MKVLTNIYDVFEHMEKRKAMFLGNGHTFQSLDSFVCGYMIAANEQQLQQPGSPYFGYFNIWLLGHIAENYGLSGGWFWQISNRNLNDDIKAFDDFFNILKIFKGSAVSTKLIVVNSQAHNFNISGPAKVLVGDERLKVPDAVRCTSIANSTTVWIEFLDESNNAFDERWYLNITEANQALAQEFGGYLKVV
jgi:hypothetical protein